MKPRRSLTCHAASLLTLFFILLISVRAVQIPMQDAIGGWTNGGSNFVVGTTGTDIGTNTWPSGESPAKLVDGDTSSNSKFLIFKDGNVGVIVTPQAGSTTLPVNRMVAWSANDAPGRDPVDFQLYGSMTQLSDAAPGFSYSNYASNYSLIVSGSFSLPSARNQAAPAYNFGHNTTAYASYLLIFTTTKPDIYDPGQDPGRTQIAEVQFFHEPPEIQVSGNGVNILDGDTSPSTADFTDFGSVATASGSYFRTFVITNTGVGRLLLTGSPAVTFHGTGAADFSVTSVSSTSIDTGSTATIIVQWSAYVGGLRTAEMRIANNDSDENPFNFTLQGTAVSSSNANLNNLALSMGTLAPVFATGTTSYAASVPYATTSIRATVQTSHVAAGVTARVNGGTYFTVFGTQSDPLALNLGANTVDVRVTAQDGTVKIYTVSVTRQPAQPPTVSGVSPPGGSTLGGDSVTITGTNFTGATGVSFGGAPATNVSVVNATTITCTTPVRPAGTASVVVTTPDGTNAENTLFTYVSPPTVSLVSPATGSTLGGTSVTITGTNFVTPLSVTFDGAAAANVSVVNATTLTCTTPAGSTGTASVVVSTRGGPNTENTLFTYGPPPTVSGVAPSTGSTLGGTSVTITGTNFTGATAVTFAGTPATSVSVVNATTITAVAPAGLAGTASVLVTTPYGISTANTFYTYVPPPTVSGVSPATGRTAGGISVTITGTNFTGATVVSFDGTPATNVSVVNATTITCTTPVRPAGTVSVLVTTPYGISAANTFYTYIAPPTVSGLTPSTGVWFKEKAVTITGTNFVAPVSVTFGLVPATNVVLVNSTTITAVTPAIDGFGNYGTVSVVVTTPYGSNPENSLFSLYEPNRAPSFALPDFTWTARDSNRNWSSITSSADGRKLAAVEYDGEIYTSVNGGVSWTPRNGRRNWQSITSSADGSKLAAVESYGQIYTSTDSGVNWTARESNRNWQSITSSADGSKLAAVVWGGQVYTSANSGVTWIARESNRNWQSITSSADGSKLAAVVNGGQIYTSTDSGVSWTARESSRNWESITSSADGSKLAAVDQDAIYTSTNSGVSWTVSSSFVGGRSITSSADGTVLAAVRAELPIRISLDGGQSWTDSGSSLQWRSITASADGTRLAVVAEGGQIHIRAPYNMNVVAGSGPSITPYLATYISPGSVDEAGQTVSFVVTNDNNALFSVQPAISSSGTLTFTPGTTLGTAMVSVKAVDNGGTADGGVDTSGTQVFTITVRPPVPTLASVFPAEGGTVGGTSVTLTGTDFGSPSAVTFGGVAATNVTVVNATTLTCTTPAGTAGTASVLVTTSGGTNAANAHYTYRLTNSAPGFSLPVTWTARASSRSWRSITSSADGSKLAAVVANGQIYTSTDSGANWTARESNRSWRSITSSADGSKLAAVVDNGQIYTSTDSGANWTARESVRDWWSITSSADGSKLAAVAWPGQIYTSTDSGVSWTARESIRDWASITSSADGSKLAAVALNDQIYTSTDSGVSWTPRESYRDWASITSSADGSKLAAVVGDGQIYTSTDSGVSWTARESSRNWQSITSSADGSKLAAVVGYGQIYTSANSGVSWTARESSRSWWSITSSADGSKLAAVVSPGQIYLTAPYNLSVVGGSGPSSTASLVTSISAGPAADAGQTVSFVVTNDNNALFSVQPTISSNGTLSFTPANTPGIATVSVVAVDNGGTAYGGEDTSSSQIFTITILPTSPTLTNASPAAGGTAGGTSVTLTGTNFVAPITVTFGRAAAGNVSVVSPSTLTCTTPAGAAGPASVLVTTSYGTNVANTLYTYVQTNSAPAFALPAPIWNARESSRGWNCITSSADGSKLAAVVGDGQIYTSADGGLSWTERESTRFWTYITSSADGSKLAAVADGSYGSGGDRIYTSTDSGVSWTARESSRSWQCITSSADGSKLAAVVIGGQIYTSTDSGVSWTARESTRYWKSITSSADGSKLAAVAGDGQIYTSTDSGVSWTARESIRNWRHITSSADGSKLAAVAADSYGSYSEKIYRIYTSADSGLSWTARESNRSWSAITSSADGSKLAAVEYNGQIYTSMDSGVNWTANESSRGWLSITSSADGNRLAAVADFNETIYVMTPYNLSVAVGSGPSSTASFATSISPGPVADAGQTVSFVVTNDHNGLFSVQPAISSSGTLTFTPGNTPGTATVSVVAMDNGGTDYGGVNTSRPQLFTITVLPPAPSLTSVSPAIGGTAGGTSVTLNGTNFVMPLNVTFDGVPAGNVTIVSPTSLTCTTPPGSVGAASVLVSAPGGMSAANTFYTYMLTNTAPSFALFDSWTARGGGNRDWLCITSSADGSKLAAVESFGQIYTSADSGVSWTARESIRGWQCITSSADGSKLAAVARNGQIYTSTDSGVSWTARESNRNWYSIASSADGSKLAAVVFGGQIYTSTDSGMSWTARESIRSWKSITSSADGNKLAAVNNGQIYTSTDSGVTWTARASGRGWNSITSSANGSKLAAVVWPGGQIYTSTDSGVSWTARESNRDWISITSSADGSKLAAVKGPGQIYTSTDSGVSWTARESNRDWVSITSSADGSKLAAVVFGGQIYTIEPSNLEIAAGSGPSSKSSFATGVSPGPASDVGQTVSFSVTNSNNALFTVQPTLSSSGTLTFTPGNTPGTATLSVVAVDNGGTANGGVDTSSPQIFTITILPAAAVPEIGVKGNNALIADGDTTPDGADHTHFGGVDAASGTVVRTFTIENTGAGTLSLTGSPLVAISGAQAADFTLTALPAASVAAGGSTSFQITFNPAATGARTATLSIANNDADENPYNFTLEGTGYTTTEAAAADWASSYPGISGTAAAPLAEPFNDGVPNLLKYAFNMPLTGPNVAPMIPGTSSGGLPAMGVNNTSGVPTSVRIEFIRRKNSGLIYTPQYGATLTNFVPATAVPQVTLIDAVWERVVVDQPLAPGQTAAFCRVAVSAP
jgi:photosystem II stability/assembly factor-like uncharacterized protein